MEGQTFSRQAQQALAFARQHDWGQEAELARSPSDNSEIVAHLLDRLTVAERYHYKWTTRPATTEAMREFGHY